MNITDSEWERMQEQFLQPSPELDKRRRQQAVARVYLSRRAPISVGPDAITDLYDVVANAIGGNAAVRYFEFGVAGGKSMRRIAERFPNPDARFFGFDSFEGLPEDWKDKPKGTFSMAGKPPVIRDKRVSFVKGLFQDTLPGFITSIDRMDTNPLLVHYDADLYSATLFVLSTLWYHVQEYYFIFDEFMSEEVIALHDFSRAYPIDLQFLCQTNAGGFPSQVFGKMRNSPNR